MIRWRRSWPELAERLPVDVMPRSNGEFIPPQATAQQRRIMEIQRAEAERWAQKMGVSRRSFLRTAAGFTVGFWAINQVRGSKFGHYALAHGDSKACTDLKDPGTGQEYQLNNLPGEFIFDIQSHHVDSGGTWRITNPGFEVFFAAIWPQSSPIPGYGQSSGEVDPIEYLSRYYYMKELYLESSTNMTVLSAVPSSPDLNPLPVHEAAETVRMVRELSGSERAVMHAFVMPNRGSFGTTSIDTGVDPVFMGQEFRMMEDHAAEYREILRAWKVYTPWGDVPNASGWFLDDRVGRKFVEKVIEVGNATGVPKTICCHKGFALPAFDQRAASPRDVGPVARDYAADGLNVIVYHSGYDSETVGKYPGDDWDESQRSVDSLIKSLRASGWSARHFAPGGTPGQPLSGGDGDPEAHGNVPNVYGEIGAVWGSVMNDPKEASHLLGKLIYYVGPKRVVWGTDSLWFGSPQSVIVGMRTFQMSDEAKELYRLPFGLDGDVENPLAPAPNPARTIRNGILGRNAAAVYGVDPDAALGKLNCDDVQAIRDAYIINPLTPKEAAPLRSNGAPAYRSRRELFRDLANKPWSP
jgi:predicted TIM-barrel fold metal-dependent hydrolase